MSTEKNELTQSQNDRLAKAEAVTSAQIDAAIRITEEKFSNYQFENKMRFLAATIQALSTNYLAEVTRASASK
ncbi:hypothetical protein CHU94_08080 [Rhodoferax sp. TH121]|uniref:hypothetical protein n=1 Tax=Rhodoferax sp. TH121 TaxID=2022803 RepID=UPI000B968B32|nr:hypothetical protein [Rhodoferax sp. TH121]OYQ41060.1 hypothetical protein CHU94_08080 [Rhodoferax sp. TH121]